MEWLLEGILRKTVDCIVNGLNLMGHNSYDKLAKYLFTMKSWILLAYYNTCLNYAQFRQSHLIVIVQRETLI